MEWLLSGCPNQYLRHTQLRLLNGGPRQGAIINAPMSTRGTEVATRGMELSTGVRNACVATCRLSRRRTEATKRHATTMADRPVRAPSMIPALLSFAMITGLVPKSAPHLGVLLGLTGSCEAHGGNGRAGKNRLAPGHVATLLSRKAPWNIAILQ